MKLVLKIAIFMFINFNVHAKPITITQVSDLNFGSLVQGDDPKSIPAGTSENASNGSFEVKGDKNLAYTIILPSSALISLNGTGSNPITISNFVSNPPEGSNGLLSSKGKQELYIGATISSIPINQIPGSYTGNFTVEVIY